MNNPSGQDPRRPDAPPSDAPRPEARSGGAPGSSLTGLEPSGLPGPDSLIRLRNRVERVLAELHQLRAENAALSARIRELEADAGSSASHPSLPLDEDPEQLRRKITSFIEAIDRYLEQDTEQGA